MQTDDTSFDYLEERVNSSIEIIKKKERRNKNKTGLLNLTAIILSALITLILGIDTSDMQVYQKNIALSLGAILTVINGWNILFNYKKLWVRQKRTLFSLYQLQSKMGYLKSQKNYDKKNTDELFSEFLEVWKVNGNEWLNLNTKSKE